MPLHLTCQCCKCRREVRDDLWAISRDHKYSAKRDVCDHFQVSIDTISRIGFIINWGNEIKVTAFYKTSGEAKIVLCKTFNRDNMEFEDYASFSNQAVIHARVSDSREIRPTCGFNVQNRIEYEEQQQQRRLEELKNLDKGKVDENERKKDLLILEKKFSKKN